MSQSKKNEHIGLYDDFFAQASKKQKQIQEDAKRARILQEKEEKKAEKRLAQQQQLEIEQQLEYMQYQQQANQQYHMQARIIAQMLQQTLMQDEEYEYESGIMPHQSADTKTYDFVMKKLKNVPTAQLERSIIQYGLDDATKMQILADILLERADDTPVVDKKTNKEKQEIITQVKKIESALADVSCKDIECAICLDKIADSGKETSCGHTFHHECIVGWINVKPLCPICKTDLS